MTETSSNGRKRLQVMISEELWNDMEEVCKKAHMSKSAWVEYTLAMAIRSYSDLIDGLRGAMAQGIVEGVEIADD